MKIGKREVLYLPTMLREFDVRYYDIVIINNKGKIDDLFIDGKTGIIIIITIYLCSKNIS